MTEKQTKIETWKQQEKKLFVIYKESQVRLIADLSSEAMEIRGSGTKSSKCLKKNANQEIHIHCKLSLRS